MKKILILVTIAIMAISCKPDTIIEERPSGEFYAYCDLSSYAYVSKWYASIYRLEVYSNVAWAVSKSADWVTVDVERHEGNGMIKIDIEQNPKKNSREAYVTITYFPDDTSMLNARTKRFLIIQNGSPIGE